MREVLGDVGPAATKVVGAQLVNEMIYGKSPIYMQRRTQLFWREKANRRVVRYTLSKIMSLDPIRLRW